MNGNELRAVLESDKNQNRPLGRVMPRDRFVKNFTKYPRGVFIFNTHEAGKPGEHWIAVISSGDRTSYFDSFGQHPQTYPDVWRALRLANKPLTWNSTRLQGLLSSVCGDYCLLYCLLDSYSWTLERFVNRMAQIPDCESRDHAVRSLTKRLLSDTLWPDYEFPSKDSGLEGKDGTHMPGSSLLTGNSGDW